MIGCLAEPGPGGAERLRFGRRAAGLGWAESVSAGVARRSNLELGPPPSNTLGTSNLVESV